MSFALDDDDRDRLAKIHAADVASSANSVMVLAVQGCGILNFWTAAKTDREIAWAKQRLLDAVAMLDQRTAA